MELFETADLFGIERLKFMCEQAIINNIDCDNAAAILHASDQHSAMRLREQTMEFIIANFDANIVVTVWPHQNFDYQVFVEVCKIFDNNMEGVR